MAARSCARLLTHVRRRFPELIELYDNTASLQDRTVGTGRVAAELVRQFGAGGYVGRAAGARSMPAAPPAIRPTTSWSSKSRS